MAFVKSNRARMIALLVVLGTICQKTESASITNPPVVVLSNSPAQSVVRFHWLGKKKIAEDTNSMGLMRIWNQLESVQLEKQTLDKLSTAPWRFLHGETATNVASSLLRPLLNDLVQQEFYLEIRQTTNGFGESVLAVRLDEQRANLWKTNLSTVLESLTGIRPTISQPSIINPQLTNGWSLKKHHSPNLIELTRAGEWTVLGVSQERNTLLLGFISHVKQGRTPFKPSSKNSWLEAEVDLPKLMRGLSWSEPLPKISLTMSSEGEKVVTRANLKFPRTLQLELEPWNFPTNLVHEPLASLTAVRGIRSWLTSMSPRTNFSLLTPPNEIFIWASQGVPMQTYFAAPLPGASNEVSRISDLILQKWAPWFAQHDLAGFQKSKSFNGVEWTGLPFMSPFLQATTFNNKEFIFGGGFSPDVASSDSAGLVPVALSRTNLIEYDSELTGLRVEQWIYIAQFIRIVSNKPQLAPGSAGLAWLKAAGEKLGPSISEISLTGADEISFVRKSSIGFTAIELQLITDWLESPRFPRDLNTFASPPAH
jgi:hypothetical protein